MGWNGSDSAQNAECGVQGSNAAPSTKHTAHRTKHTAPGTKYTAPGTKHKAPGTKHGLLAGLIVVALGGAALWWFAQGTRHQAPSAKHEARGTITQAKPAIPAEDPKVIKPSGKKHPPRQLTVDRKSAVATPNIASNSLVITYGMVNGKSIFKRPVFRHNSENLICAVLTTQPGLRIIDIPLGKRFEEDFANSLLDPIRIEDGDTPEEIELKQLMVDVKKELVERIKAGENLSDIITEARKDINKLAQYNEDVRHAYYEMRKNAADMTEVEEFRLAANKMLEERGLPPIRADKRGKYKVDQPLDAPSKDAAE